MYVCVCVCVCVRGVSVCVKRIPHWKLKYFLIQIEQYSSGHF